MGVFLTPLLLLGPEVCPVGPRARTPAANRASLSPIRTGDSPRGPPKLRGKEEHHLLPTQAGLHLPGNSCAPRFVKEF